MEILPWIIADVKVTALYEDTMRLVYRPRKNVARDDLLKLREDRN